MPGPIVSRSLFLSDLISEQNAGTDRYVNGSTGAANNDGLSFGTAYLTIQAAVNAAAAGDRILIAPGDYAEAVTITKDNLTFIGQGSRGSVSVAPGGNGIAWLIDGTTAAGRVEEVRFINIGGEGAGTGGGLHVKGNIRRLRFEACKFEGGAFGVKLESTAAGSVGDLVFRDCEFAWTTTGLSILSSGGGDPVTQVLVDYSWFHNCSADAIKSTVTAPANLWINATRFDDNEAGTAPTGLYIDAQVANTSGTVTGCSFPVAVNGGKVLVAATCIVLGCFFTGGVNTTAPT